MCKPLPRHSHFHTLKLYANASRFFFHHNCLFHFVFHHLRQSPPLSITSYVYHLLCLSPSLSYTTFVYHRLCLLPPLSFTIPVYHHPCLSPPSSFATFVFHHLCLFPPLSITTFPTRHLPPRHLSPPNSPLRLITISISSLRFISKCSQLLGH